MFLRILNRGVALAGVALHFDARAFPALVIERSKSRGSLKSNRNPKTSCFHGLYLNLNRETQAIG